MAGGNHHKSSASHGGKSSFSHSSHRKPHNNHPHPSSAAATSAHHPNLSKPSSGPPAPAKPSPRPGPSPGIAQPRPSIDPNSPLPHFSDLGGLGPPPPPSYDIHMLERRTIVLADGSVRSYFALPPDYQDFPLPLRMEPSGRFFPGGLRPEFGELHPRGRQQDYWSSLGLDAGRAGPSEGPGKRKLGEADERERLEEAQDKARKRQQLLQYGNADGPIGAAPRSEFFQGGGGPFRGGEEFRGSKYGRENVRLKHLEVDQNALKKAFLHYVKVVNENNHHKKNYMENGRNGTLKCLACSRSRDYPDMHNLIIHTYNPENAALLVDHLGFYKALCTLMGWNYSKPPDNSKAYQSLSAEQAIANQEDLIIWPPTIVIHNTITGKNKEGRMEGVGIKSMDNLIRELGFVGGKSKSLYGREGHLGITLIKFASDKSGLKEAMKLAEHFEKENHGRRGWARLQPLTLGKDDENNPNLVRVDGRSGEKRRIFYGFLGTATDMDKLDFDTRKKAGVESLREYISS